MSDTLEDMKFLRSLIPAIRPRNGNAMILVYLEDRIDGVAFPLTTHDQVDQALVTFRTKVMGTTLFYSVQRCSLERCLSAPVSIMPALATYWRILEKEENNEWIKLGREVTNLFKTMAESIPSSNFLAPNQRAESLKSSLNFLRIDLQVLVASYSEDENEKQHAAGTQCMETDLPETSVGLAIVTDFANAAENQQVSSFD